MPAQIETGSMFATGLASISTFLFIDVTQPLFVVTISWTLKGPSPV